MTEGVKVPIVADVKKFEEGLKQAEASSNKFFDSIKKGASKLYGTVDSVVTAMFGAEALAGIGIWSGFLALFTGAMGIVKKENQEIVNKLAYVKAMLQSAYRSLMDIATKFMNWILDGIIKVAYWIDYIVQAWFGISLLAKTGDEYAKSMKQAEKSAKEIRKQLMGFDEANVLQDTSSNNNGALTPTAFSIDAKQIPIPDWVKWIAEHKDLIIGLAEAVGIAFAGIKLTGWLANLAQVFGVAGPLGAVGGTGLAGIASSLLAITAIATGIVVIVSIPQYIWTDLQKLQTEMKKLNEINKQHNQEWLLSLDPIKDYASYTGTISANLTNGKESLKKSRDPLNRLLGLSDDFLDNAKGVADNTGIIAQKAREALDSEKLTKEQKEELLRLLEQYYEYAQDVTTELQNSGQATEDLTTKTDYLYQVMQMYRTETDKSNDIWWEIDGGVCQTMEDVKRLNKTKVEDKKFTVDAKVNTNDAEKKVNGLIQGAAVALRLISPAANIVGMVNDAKTIVKRLFPSSNSGGGGGTGFDNGGIVLPQPGHGVPIGSVMSERRAEAIVPLENPTAMDKLGEAIGKYVNLAITNNMVVDARVLASATNNQVNKERFLMNR